MPTPLPSPLPDSPTPMPPGGLRGLLKSFGGADAYGNPPEPRTGSITVLAGQGVGNVYLRSGRVYAIGYSGFVPPLARRLLTSGFIGRDEYDALAATGAPDDEETIRRTVAVPVDSVENLNRQMLLSSLTHLYTWKPAEWVWEEGAATARNTISALEPGLLVTATDERQGQWGALRRNYPQVTDPDAVPSPGPEFTHTPPPGANPESVAVLRMVDGLTANRVIAGTLGLTRFELAGRLAAAVAEGSVVYAEGGAAGAPSGSRRRVPAGGQGAAEPEADAGVGEELAALLVERESLVERLAKVDAQIDDLRGV